MTENDAIKTYKYNPVQANILIFSGVVLLLAMLALALYKPGAGIMNIGLAIMLIVVGIYNHSRQPVRLFNDYMEVKLGVLSSLTLVRYADITNIKRVNKNKTIISYRNGEGESSLALHWKVLPANAQQSLLALLKKKTRVSG